MERLISQAERISRAEEIYNRRQMERGIRVPQRVVNNKPKKKRRLLKKFFFCLNVYLIVMIARNYNYIFSEDVIKKTQEILSYNVKIEEIYKTLTNKFKNMSGFFGTLNGENKNEINGNEEVEENLNEISQTGGEIANIEIADAESPASSGEVVDAQANENIKNGEGAALGIGGGGEAENTVVEEKSQMEMDAEFIKQNYNLILPIKGTVTSRFGSREATNIVSSNHTGIDIGANIGTVIASSTDGTVLSVTSDEYYRKICKNTARRIDNSIRSL